VDLDTYLVFFME